MQGFLAALVLAATLLIAATPASAFYLPGVAPQDFARVRGRAGAAVPDG